MSSCGFSGKYVATRIEDKILGSIIVSKVSDDETVMSNLSDSGSLNFVSLNSVFGSLGSQQTVSWLIFMLNTI